VSQDKQSTGTAASTEGRWAAIAQDPKFRELRSRKTKFLFGWWIFSTLYYFFLPVGASFFPELFKWRIAGHMNFGYVFALSQFFVCWGIAIYYASWANRVSDRLSKELLTELKA
jgi:uncharacterized membrane protein (DUF485 family)